MLFSSSASYLTFEWLFNKWLDFWLCPARQTYFLISFKSRITGVLLTQSYIVLKKSCSLFALASFNPSRWIVLVFESLIRLCCPHLHWLYYYYYYWLFYSLKNSIKFWQNLALAVDICFLRCTHCYKKGSVLHQRWCREWRRDVRKRSDSFEELFKMNWISGK